MTPRYAAAAAAAAATITATTHRHHHVVMFVHSQPQTSKGDGALIQPILAWGYQGDECVPRCSLPSARLVAGLAAGWGRLRPLCRLRDSLRAPRSVGCGYRYGWRWVAG